MSNKYEVEILIRKTYVVTCDDESDVKRIVSEKIDADDFDIDNILELHNEDMVKAAEFLADECLEDD